jgi:hypothetical protein
MRLPIKSLQGLFSITDLPRCSDRSGEITMPLFKFPINSFVSLNPELNKDILLPITKLGDGCTVIQLTN